MSINFSFFNDSFCLEKLALPTRHYYFKEEENYIKLLCVGEGIFPKDRIKSFISLENSSLICTTESATKIYPSSYELSVNLIDVKLKDSNFEFINDELILYKDANFLQLLKIKSDAKSTFFYTDILSQGRSFEKFDFRKMNAKNSFSVDEELEYLEKYSVSGKELLEYTKDMKNSYFAKIYIKTHNNEQFLENLVANGFQSFSFTCKKKMLIGALSAENILELKKKTFEVWELYRSFLGKKKFVLGKQ